MASHILVIEDDTAIREMICFTLKHEGFGYHAVADGEQGLENAVNVILGIIIIAVLTGLRIITSKCSPDFRED